MLARHTWKLFGQLTVGQRIQLFHANACASTRVSRHGDRKSARARHCLAHARYCITASSVARLRKGDTVEFQKTGKKSADRWNHTRIQRCKNRLTFKLVFFVTTMLFGNVLYVIVY
jgi:hypothetical protein